MSEQEQESPPFTDPGDTRILNREWDSMFGFMIGYLLAHGYTPAQIQVKARFVADGVRRALRSPGGAEAAEDIQRGMGTLADKITEDDE